MGHVRRTGEMYLQDDVPIRHRHVLERLVAQDAGVVDQYVDRAVGIDRSVDDAFGALGIGDRIFVCNRHTARSRDFLDHRVGHIAGTRAIHGSAQIVHHDFRPAFGELECMAATQSATGPSHDCDFVFKAHDVSPFNRHRILPRSGSKTQHAVIARILAAA